MPTLVVINILLSITVTALVSYIFVPKLITYYTEKKKLRETQQKQVIKEIVIEFLKELKDD